MDHQLSRCQYVVLPARPSIQFQERALCDGAYDFWKNYWRRVFRTKAPDFWDPMDFFRQSLVYCLYYDGVLVAQNLSTFFHLDDHITYELPYFEGFEGAPAALLKSEGVKSVMTVEYTAVHPGYGERRTGIRFAEVMNGLAADMFRELNFDATIGTPRKLSGLNDVAMSFGYRKVGDNYQKAGWELDVLVGLKGELGYHPDAVYRSIIRTLWENRIDYTKSAKHIEMQKNKTKTKEEPMRSESIRSVYSETMDGLALKIDSFDWADKNFYSLWLAQAYYLVRHTTRLLALSAGLCPFENEETHKRIVQHLGEETGHDAIALADLKALGADLTLLPEITQTTKLITMQYDLMKEYSGLAFFGYVLLLEGLAVKRGEKLSGIVTEKFGPRAARFLKTHAEDDIEHIERALEQIESFSPEDQAIVIRNFRDSSQLYHAMLDYVGEVAGIDSRREKWIAPQAFQSESSISQ